MTKNDNPYNSPQTDKRVFEYLAMYILRNVYGEEYSTLCFVGGNATPDLQDESKSIGVEVVRAFPESDNIVNSLFRQYGGMQKNDIPQWVYRKFSDYCYYPSFVNGVLDMLTYIGNEYYKDKREETEKCFSDAIKSKIEKMKSTHYSHFNRQELFVYSYGCCDIDMIDSSVVRISNDCFEQLNQLSEIHIVNTDSKLLYRVTGGKTCFTKSVYDIYGECWTRAYQETGMKAVMDEYVKKLFEMKS